MRIHRIALKDVKAVRDCDVTLCDGDSGVTVVEGPNEVGKSSLAEALELLLDHYDSTTRSEVRALQPAGRDVGSEIEVEISTGPYRFTYFKRFNKQTETRLSVSQPSAEQLTGRAAHDRVREILDETIDVDLWGALRVRQGTELEQAVVGHTRALARAIDDRVSATAIGQRETALYEAITDEYQRYWTPTGLESKTLRESADAADEAQRRVQDLEARLAELERDIERVGNLEQRVPQMEGELREARRTATQRATELRAVEGLEERVERCRLGLQKVQAEHTSVADRVQARRDLVDELERAREELAKRQDEAEGGEDRIQRTVGRLEAARGDLEEARRHLREAERTAERRRRDLDHLRDLRDLAQLRERRTRAQAASERRTAAAAILAGISVDADLFEHLREQHLAVERARGSLEVGSSALELVAEADLDLTVDGRSVTVTEGTERTWTATDDLAVAVPGVGTFTVRPGAGIEPLTRRLEEAETDLSVLLERAGVADLAAAEDTLRRRRDAEADIESADRAYEEALDGTGLAALDERISQLDARVSAYLEGRPDEPPLPDDEAAAAALRDTADERAQRAHERFEDARAAEQQVRDLLEEVRDAHTDRGVQVEVARERVAGLETRLREARQREPDDVLDTALAEADDAVDAAQRELAAAETELEEAEPGSVRALADNAQATVEAARSRLREAEDERRELRATVEMRGGEGLAADRDAAASTAARLQAEDRSLRRRAEAARLLYETFTECREEAKRTYARPLREQIVKLGRILYDPSFDVTLDEDLRIEERVLDGTPLPFEQLSGGAKEQLALIGRLACAMLVADDGGAPLIIDDSLGYSDPDRLEAMGAILHLAGQECQVIVLTCYPERYRHVGGARTVRVA